MAIVPVQWNFIFQVQFLWVIKKHISSLVLLNNNHLASCLLEFSLSQKQLCDFKDWNNKKARTTNVKQKVGVQDANLVWKHLLKNVRIPEMSNKYCLVNLASKPWYVSFKKFHIVQQIRLIFPYIMLLINLEISIPSGQLSSYYV